MAQLEERMAKVEGILSQIDKRLIEWINHFDAELRALRTEMRSEMGSLRSEMGDLRTEIRQLRFWMFGILIPMWVTIILTILFKP